MRKVRHKNIVQFIGACTRKPNLCIVFEFMQGGSVYDVVRRVRGACGRPLRSTPGVRDGARGRLALSLTWGSLLCPGALLARGAQEGALRLSQVLRIAVEVSRGMDYLHQRKIIHRDLKAANLLMDDHGVVKVRA